MQDFTSFVSKHDNSNPMNKSEIYETLKIKLERLLSEKIYFLNTNIEFLDDWMFSAIQSNDKNVRRTVKWYYSMHISELDDIILGFIKDIGKEDIGENELNKEFDKLIRKGDKYKSDVIQIYKMVLNRYPDNSELLHYSNMLKYDIIDTERIEEILKESDDYNILENKRKDTNKEIDMASPDRNLLAPDFKFGAKINTKEISIPKVTKGNIDIDSIIDEHYTNIIDRAYEEILQRNVGGNGLYVDSDGLKTYLPLMKNGMTEERLRIILRNSQEYKDKFGIYQHETDGTKPTMPETVHISDKKIKSHTITGISSITDSESVPKDVSRLKIVYCMMGTNRLLEIKPYIESVVPYVDKFIFIDGGSEDGTVEYLKSLNKGKEEKIDIYVYPWQDRFSAQRNNYLNKLRDKNYNGWVIVSDTDEHFPVESLKKIREILPELEKKGNNAIAVNAVDIIADDDDYNKEINRIPSNYWKLLIFKYSQNLRYEGEPHETLIGYSANTFKSNITYEHRRSNLHVLSRATENFFISNSNRYSEKWAEFRVLCSESGILSFKDYWKLFTEHNLPKSIEGWIYRHKNDNFDPGDSEVRETYQLYFEVLPERMKRKAEKNKDKSKEPLKDVPILKDPKNKTISDIRNKLKDDITKLLQEFESNTGLIVKSIDLDKDKDNVYVKTIIIE